MSDIKNNQPCLVIGDVHGHLDRLEALLKQEGIIGPCPECDGTGGNPYCESCEGEGITRTNEDVLVIQLGDLGHLGAENALADVLCYKYGSRWLDYILWGNHDIASIDSNHRFRDYAPPYRETNSYMRMLFEEGRLFFAYETHGFLLTHAGLHAAFKHQPIDDHIKKDLSTFVKWINQYNPFSSERFPLDLIATINAIGYSRGGRSPHGGILWRDANEKLYPDFRQIFGHTSKDKVRKYHSNSGYSYCIDVGDKNNGRLVGIWLPDERIVEINLNNEPLS